MYCSISTLLLLSTTVLAALQGGNPIPPTRTWCGTWAGSLRVHDNPSVALLPNLDDGTRRLFVEPQLMDVPFSSVADRGSAVQLPKFWGTNQFRLALLSYNDGQRTYARGISRWKDFESAFITLLTTCVQRGIGGAQQVALAPGSVRGTPAMVLYAYEIGSEFDTVMNLYMTNPRGINPAAFEDLARGNGSAAGVS